MPKGAGLFAWLRGWAIVSGMTTRIGILLSSLLLALLLVAPGCGKKKEELSGIGPWVIHKTTLERWGNINMCTPAGELMWCQSSPLEKSHTVSLGGQDAAVGAYFQGKDPESPLVEIDLMLDSCQPEKLQSWLRGTFGKPTVDKGRVSHWKGKLVFVSAKLGSKCEVVMVASDDKKRIGELEAGKD